MVTAFLYFSIETNVKHPNWLQLCGMATKQPVKPGIKPKKMINYLHYKLRNQKTKKLAYRQTSWN
jgi:hypothetical protein